MRATSSGSSSPSPAGRSVTPLLARGWQLRYVTVSPRCAPEIWWRTSWEDRDVRVPIARGRPESGAGSGLSGTARVDKRTKNLVKRLQPGQIAVVDHIDIDKVAA